MYGEFKPDIRQPKKKKQQTNTPEKAKRIMKYPFHGIT